jgi:hypothetical protein
MNSTSFAVQNQHFDCVSAIFGGHFKKDHLFKMCKIEISGLSEFCRPGLAGQLEEYKKSPMLEGIFEGAPLQLRQADNRPKIEPSEISSLLILGKDKTDFAAELNNMTERLSKNTGSNISQEKLVFNITGV